jgi:hypothetical protein
MAMWGYYWATMYALGHDAATGLLAILAVMVLALLQLLAYVVCGALWKRSGGRVEAWLVSAATLLLVSPIAPNVHQDYFIGVTLVLHTLSAISCALLMLRPGVTGKRDSPPLVYWTPVAVVFLSIPWYLDQARFMVS